MSCTIDTKTVKFNKNTLKNFEELKLEMTKKPGKGYCDKSVEYDISQ